MKKNTLLIYLKLLLLAWMPLANLRAIPLWVFSGGGVSVPGTGINHAVFNGTNTYLRASAASPTGLIDAKTGSISFWIKPAADGVGYRVLSIGNGNIARFSVARGSTNVIAIQGWNSAGTQILDIRSTSTVLAASGWTHVHACWDLANTALRKIYLNGVSDTVNAVIYTNEIIDYVSTTPRITVGADFADIAANIMNGGLGELLFDEGYNDVIGDYYAGGKAVPVGANGQLVTGISPPIYFSGAGSGNSWETNSGTGGALVRNGTLTVDVSPPQFP